MPIVGARAYVDVAAPQKRAAGILESATVVDVSDPHALLGAEYQTNLCGLAGLWSDNCDMSPAEGKTFGGVTVVEGDPITVYDAVECGPVGTPYAEFEQMARDGLAFKEGYAVEASLREWFLAEGDSVTTGTPVAAVAGLEAWLGENYSAQGLIHMGPTTGVRARSQHAVLGEGAEAHTAMGTPVVLGYGYQAAGASSFSAFASGRITLLRGPVMVNTVPISFDGTGDALNAMRVVAERTYVPLVECGAAKVVVTWP